MRLRPQGKLIFLFLLLLSSHGEAGVLRRLGFSCLALGGISSSAYLGNLYWTRTPQEIPAFEPAQIKVDPHRIFPLGPEVRESVARQLVSTPKVVSFERNGRVPSVNVMNSGLSTFLASQIKPVIAAKEKIPVEQLGKTEEGIIVRFLHFTMLAHGEKQTVFEFKGEFWQLQTEPFSLDQLLSGEPVEVKFKPMTIKEGDAEVVIQGGVQFHFTERDTIQFLHGQLSFRVFKPNLVNYLETKDLPATETQPLEILFPHRAQAVLSTAPSSGPAYH